MNALIENVTVVRNAKGKPDYVVIPFADYQAFILGKEKSKSLIPSEVIRISMIDENLSALGAWRRYLNLTQEEVAKRLKISQAAYSKLEARKTMRQTTREKVAKALGLVPEQLDF